MGRGRVDAGVLVLPPGESASAVGILSDVPGKGDAERGSCQPVATHTQVIPPNDTHFVVAVGPGTPVCEGGTIRLSPLQAGSNAGA